MSTLQERITELMQTKGWTVGDVAKHAEVNSSAVSQWLGAGKGTKRIASVRTAIKLQNASGFSALWLADGEGPKMLGAPLQAHEPAPAWPLPIVDQQRYMNLPESQRFAAQAAMLQKIEEAEREQSKDPHAWPAAPQSTLLTGT